MNEQFEFLDVLTILSFVIALQNLSLNVQQVDGLDRHLKEQDRLLESDLKELLGKSIAQNEEIIKLLKELKHAHQNA